VSTFGTQINIIFFEREYTGMIQPPGDCPICKRVDFVQKVPAIYRNSFSTTMETQVTTTTTVTYNSEGQPTYNSVPETTIVPVTRQTKLGVLLKPPQIKTIPLPMGEKIIFWLCPILAVAVYIGPPLFFPHLLDFLGEYPNGAILLLPFLSMCGLAIGLPVLLGVLTHRVFFRRANERRRELKQQEQERWQHLAQQWELFCYCHRCDCVFFPGNEKAVPPEQLEQLYSGVPYLLNGL
jgi:hypothetical protein